MAVFEVNYYSYCHARNITMTVVIPTPGPTEIPFKKEARSMLTVDQNDFNVLVPSVPRYERLEMGMGNTEALPLRQTACPVPAHSSGPLSALAIFLIIPQAPAQR